MSPPFSHLLRLGEIGREPIVVKLSPDEGQRAAIAKDLRILGLPSFSGEVTVKPWLDGVEINGRLKAMVVQACSVSLDPFEAPVEATFEVRAVPAGSALASVDEGGELELDPDADDPPDVLDSDTLDLAAYLVEHLALEIDPFPRKPGAKFEFTSPPEPESPFAALKALKDSKPQE